MRAQLHVEIEAKKADEAATTADALSASVQARTLSSITPKEQLVAAYASKTYFRGRLTVEVHGNSTASFRAHMLAAAEGSKCATGKEIYQKEAAGEGQGEEYEYSYEYSYSYAEELEGAELYGGGGGQGGKPAQGGEPGGGEGGGEGAVPVPSGLWSRSVARKASHAWAAWPAFRQ